MLNSSGNKPVKHFKENSKIAECATCSCWKILIFISTGRARIFFETMSSIHEILFHKIVVEENLA